MRIEHTIAPVFDKNAHILILGSMPSPKSRELGFYYGHPQNRFWRVLGAVLGTSIPITKDEKTAYLLAHRIALWDVLAACDINGASDASIRNAVPNDFTPIFTTASIRAVFTTGTKATGLYRKLCEPRGDMPTHSLPSTSPANQGRYPLEKLIAAYQSITQYL